MKKSNVVAASAVALSAALASGSALAHGTLAVGTASYNAASVAAAADTVTVPWGTAAQAVYTVTNTSTKTTSLEVNSRFTVTLPSGFTFSSSPALTVTGGVGGTAAAVLGGGGGIGTQSATFIIQGAPVGPGGQLALQQVAVSGATALASPGAQLQITVQSTNNAQIDNNDPKPVSPTVTAPALPGPTNTFAFTSNSGVTATFFAGAGNGIDLTSPSLGTLFTTTPFAFPVSTGDTTTIDIGTLSLLPAPNTLLADGTPNTLSSTDTATVTISGFFNGIKAAAVTVAGTPVVVVAPTGNSITFPNAPLFSDITLTANGTTLLSQNFPQSGFTASFGPGTGVTDFLTGQAMNTVDGYSFAGGTPIGITNFLTGTDAGYQTLVRLTNGGTSSSQLFAEAQPYSGGPPLVGPLGSIGAGTGTVFTEADIASATGLSLANSGARATLTIIAIPGNGVTGSGLLVNPGGVVDNVN